MRRSFPLLLTLGALVAAGCGERPEPVAGDLSPYPATVTGAGPDPLTVERAPERIVALTLGAAEVVADLGAEERLVGVPAAFEGAPQAARVVRPSGLVDPAAVVAARPDLVVAGTENNREELERALARGDAEVYVQPDTSLPDVVRATLELGLLLDAPLRARHIASRIRAAMARVERDVRARAPVPVFVDLGFFVTPRADSLVADIVRRAGGELLGLEIAGAPSDACEVLELRPRVVLRVTEALPERSLVPALRACGGGRIPRVVDVPGSLLGVAGPRAGEALEAVAQALHADAR